MEKEIFKQITDNVSITELFSLKLNSSINYLLSKVNFKENIDNELMQPLLDFNQILSETILKVYKTENGKKYPATLQSNEVNKLISSEPINTANL